jgi:phosphoribosyl-AMP cyclohydrolase
MIRAICVARMPPYRQREIDCLHFVTEIGMNDRETGLVLDPKWDATGLITGVVTDATSGELLMVAHLNAEALVLTQSTGEAHFWSRSRGRIWRKGEESGNVLRVVELRIDCDQDALWIRAEAKGPACHTGARSCFYRVVEGITLTQT